MAYPPYQMKGPALYKSKPLHKDLPEGYTKEDAKFLKEQNEDVVRYEDLDAKGRAIWKKQGKKIPKTTKKKTKTVEDYLNEGFSQAEAEQMAKDGATTGKSAVPFLGKLAKGVGKFAKGMVTGKDGKFGIGDVGRLALGPMGAVAGGAMGAGLFKKGKKPNKKH